MRVLMTADAVGGVWQYAIQLSSLLASRGAHVMLATMGPEPSDAQRAEAAAIPRMLLRTSRLALEWMPNAWSDVDRAASWLLSLEAEFEPDVVHLNGYAHGRLSWRAPALVVGHSCVWSWWDAVHGSRPPAEWDEYAVRVKAGLLAAHAVAAPSRAMAGAFQRFYGVDREVAIVPNCRDGTAWMRREKEPLIFSAGRVWDPAKNIAILDDVAGDLPWPVYVAGDMTGPSVDAPVLSHVRGLGRLATSALADWMGRAAIYVLPARYEPFGLSVLEAALCECALVLGDIPSLRENWTGVAHFVHPGRRDELQRTLQALIADPAARKALGSAARDRARGFTPTRHVMSYEDLYRGMVMSHGRTAHSSRSL
jgi:glycogen synthase